MQGLFCKHIMISRPNFHVEFGTACTYVCVPLRTLLHISIVLLMKDAFDYITAV